MPKVRRRLPESRHCGFDQKMEGLSLELLQEVSTIKSTLLKTNFPHFLLHSTSSCISRLFNRPRSYLVWPGTGELEEMTKEIHFDSSRTWLGILFWKKCDFCATLVFLFTGKRFMSGRMSTRTLSRTLPTPWL